MESPSKFENYLNGNRVVVVQTTKRKFELSVHESVIQRNAVEAAANNRLHSNEKFMTWWLK